MGFRPGATRHPQASEALRRHVLGQAVDMNQAIGLIAICMALTARRASILFGEPEVHDTWDVEAWQKAEASEADLLFGVATPLPDGDAKEARAIHDLRLEARPSPSPAQPTPPDPHAESPPPFTTS